MKKFYAWYQKHITGAIFTGLILGILTGLLLADRFTPILTVTGVIGGIYMNALNMMIFPMVFCSIVMGICSIGNAKTTGKITGYLHHNMGAALPHHFRKQLLQHNRLRRCIF